MKRSILAAGALLAPLLVSGGCQKSGGQPSGENQGGSGQGQPSGQSTVTESQQAAEQGFKQAQEAQKKAVDLEQQAQRAQQDAQQLKQKLGQAEQKALQTREQANQAQQQARQQAQNAQQIAEQSQQRAAQAQHQMTGGMAPGALSGTLAQAGPNRVLIQVPGESQPTPVNVTPQTQVTLDGKQSSSAQLPPGAQVRTSYEVQQGQPTAIRVDASSPQGSGGQQAPGPSEKPQ